MVLPSFYVSHKLNHRVLKPLDSARLAKSGRGPLPLLPRARRELVSVWEPALEPASALASAQGLLRC